MRKVQGLHAPLKMMYEKKAVSKVGHFACISNRSNFQLDILEGNDDMISFNDVWVDLKITKEWLTPMT